VGPANHAIGGAGIADRAMTARPSDLRPGDGFACEWSNTLSTRIVVRHAQQAGLKMIKRLVAAPIAAILALALVTPVLAAGPSRDPDSDVTLQFGTRDVCSFPVRPDIDSNGYVLTFDTWLMFTGRIVATVTNESTDVQFVANISGPAKYVPNEDGSLSISGGGPWLIFNFANDPWGAGMWLTAGRILVEIADDGTMTSVTLLGTRTDVCALLG
jgi:hypothetical protein